VVPYALRALDNDKTRLKAIQTLGMVRDLRATPELVAALQDHSPEVRRGASWALGESATLVRSKD
jgi:HEAT repeat protein